MEFFEGINKIGEDATSPYSVTWSNVAVGNYVLTAVATDNGGGARTSAPVALSIRTNIPPTISISGPRYQPL